MPLYFFHLSFGDRTLPDEEGVELSHRAAAREEALAVVRDLSAPPFSGNPRRWASWFLQVADHAGEFFRAPIGHPALEVVTANGHKLHAEERNSKPTRAVRHGHPSQSAPSETRAAELVRQMLEGRQSIAQLLKTNERLHEELSSLCRASEKIRAHARQVVARSRLAYSIDDVGRIAT